MIVRKILIVGSGGREHAIAWKLAQDSRRTQLYCAPGNPGISGLGQCVDIDVNDIDALARFAASNDVDLTVVGPEAPLAAGIVDEFQRRGLRIFGPCKAAARLEGSKAYAKAVMGELGIPTAHHHTFTDRDAALEYVEAHGAPVVVKADGLAAGKGVVVAHTLDAAREALDQMFTERRFGAAGHTVVIEDFLEGREATVMAFVSGRTVRTMVAAQDHKPLLDGDRGPNTGGMGTYSPVPGVDDDLIAHVDQTILQPVADYFDERGIGFTGVLYAGLMLTDDGPYVVEFNVRFGDPETQVVLPRLEGRLIEVLDSVVDGTLDAVDVSWTDDAAVCVVLAADGYPGTPRDGDVIHGLGEQVGSAIVFHAGTSARDGAVVTAGGRVLGVTGRGPDIVSAHREAYRRVHGISFDGAQFRTDIAHEALAGATSTGTAAVAGARN